MPLAWSTGTTVTFLSPQTCILVLIYAVSNFYPALFQLRFLLSPGFSLIIIFLKRHSWHQSPISRLFSNITGMEEAYHDNNQNQDDDKVNRPAGP
jgi:hypothetical protein